MITKLHIHNFRSIESADLELGKITVLTGANNSGKSSFIYALLALKNIVNNPNQSIDNFLTLPFINLGGFEQTVFNKNTGTNMLLGVSINDGWEIEYYISINPKSSSVTLTNFKPNDTYHNINIAFPYALNKSEELTFPYDKKEIKLTWNGFTSHSSDMEPQFNPFNIPVNIISNIDFVPIKRGFTMPYYGRVPLQTQISTEEEIGTLLSIDEELSKNVAYYLEKIVERRFSVFTTPGTANFYLRTTDKKTGFTSDLVNEGLGTNQLVTILAKILQSKNKFICIDEPEIHLHPSIIAKLVSVMVEIAEKEGKQFLLSTHSEHFITSLLTSVAKKEIDSDDVKVYYLSKDGKETKTELQAINKYGQIEGGLKNFYATELDNLKTLFKITD